MVHENDTTAVMGEAVMVVTGGCAGIVNPHLLKAADVGHQAIIRARRTRRNA